MPYRTMIAMVLGLGLTMPGVLHAWWHWDANETRVSPVEDTLVKHMAGVNAQVFAASGGAWMVTGVARESLRTQFVTAYEGRTANPGADWVNSDIETYTAAVARFEVVPPSVTHSETKKQALWGLNDVYADTCCVYVASGNKNTSGWSAPVRIFGNSSETWIQDLAMATTGRSVHAVWVAFGYDGFYRLYYARSPNQGNSGTWRDQVILDSTDQCDVTSPSVAASESTVNVFWIRDQCEVWHAFSADTGNSWHRDSEYIYDTEEYYALSAAALGAYVYVTYYDCGTMLGISSDGGQTWLEDPYEVPCNGDFEYGSARLWVFPRPGVAGGGHGIVIACTALVDTGPGVTLRSLRTLFRTQTKLYREGEMAQITDRPVVTIGGDVQNGMPMLRRIELLPQTHGDIEYYRGAFFCPNDAVDRIEPPGRASQLCRSGDGGSLVAIADIGVGETCVGYRSPPDTGGLYAIERGHHPALAIASGDGPWVCYLRHDTVWCAALAADNEWAIKPIFAGSSTHRPGPPALAVFQGSGDRIGNVVFPVYDSVGTGRSTILFSQFDTLGNVVLDTVDYCDGSYGDSAVSLCSGISDTLHVAYGRGDSVYYRTLTYAPTSMSRPDTWSSPVMLNDAGAAARHPYIDQFKNRVYVAFRQQQAAGTGTTIAIKRTSKVAGTSLAWEGLSSMSDNSSAPKDWPTLSTDQVVVWSESLNGHWVSRARVAESLLTLTSPDSNSRFCHVLADTAVADAPSTSKTRIRYLWTQQLAGDTWAVQYALKDVKVSNADGNATRYNNGSKLVRDGNDTLHTVYRTRAGAVYHAQKPDEPNASWTASSLASSGDLPALDKDYADRLWAVYRKSDDLQLECRYRTNGSTVWPSFTVYECNSIGNRLIGAPAIAAAPYDPSEQGATAAYIAFVVYDSTDERNSLVMVKVDTTGVMYTDTVEYLRPEKDGLDSFPALALAVMPDCGYYIYLLWQQNDSIVNVLSTEPDYPGAGKPTKVPWTSSGAVSNPSNPARHPALAANSALVTAAWVEDAPGEIIARQQEVGAGYNAWGDRYYVSSCPDTACEYPTVSAGDSLIVAYQKAVGTGNWDIMGNINLGTTVNLTGTSQSSSCGHVVFELHDDSVPLVHCVWTEDLSANYSEVGYRRWQLGVTGGGYGGGQSAGRIDPTITPGLLAPAPNPFRDRTTIAYATNTTGPVRVRIYDALGREVCALVNAQHQPGRYRATWDRKDNRGRQAAKGIYFVRLDTPNCRQNRKLILVP